MTYYVFSGTLNPTLFTRFIAVGVFWSRVLYGPWRQARQAAAAPLLLGVQLVAMATQGHPAPWLPPAVSVGGKRSWTV